MDYIRILHAIVEMPEFQRKCSKLLTDAEKTALINHLAKHPQDGVLMQGTGGIRKLRWGVGGRGKRGGARVIYYYHNVSTPLFLLTVFGKSDKVNLTKSECNDLAKLTNQLINHYGEHNV